MAKVVPKVVVRRNKRKPSRSWALYPFDKLKLIGQTFLVENIDSERISSIRVQASKQGESRGVRYRVFTFPRCGKCGFKPRDKVNSGSMCRSCGKGFMNKADVEVELNSMTR